MITATNEQSEKFMLAKIKPAAFTLFAKWYGPEALMDFETNELLGIVYHRDCISGDYDDFNNVDDLIIFIKTSICQHNDSDDAMR